MSRAVVLALALSALTSTACQTSVASSEEPKPYVSPDEEEEVIQPVRRDPSTLPAPGRKMPAAFVHWSYLDPVWETSLHTLRGSDLDLAQYQGKAVLFVNTASKCGQTKQYAALEAIQKKYEARGFTVVGFPCNQFADQEPGSEAQIAEFCSTTYGVTFPMTQKIDVNGETRHPIYKLLAPIKDPMGYQGDIRWNFEKFIVSADGTEITRFGPRVQADDPMVIAAIEAALPEAQN